MAEDEEYQGMEEDELEEGEEVEEDFDDIPEPKVRATSTTNVARGRGRPPKGNSDNAPRESRGPVKTPQKVVPRTEENRDSPPEPRRRFEVLTQPERIVLVDTESNEVLGEGQLLVHQALADIIERLERIETNLGSMSGI